MGRYVYVSVHKEGLGPSNGGINSSDRILSNTNIHTYHSCLIPEGLAEASQIFLRDADYQNDLAIRNTAEVTGGKPVAV
jgi:hypothetical protein